MRTVTFIEVLFSAFVGRDELHVLLVLCHLGKP